MLFFKLELPINDCFTFFKFNTSTSGKNHARKLTKSKLYSQLNVSIVAIILT